MSIAQILTWADAHHLRTAAWPKQDTGLVIDNKNENWSAVGLALRKGHRGLPGRISLAQLLAEHRGVKNLLRQPAFSEAKILAWADAFQRRHGRWPQAGDGIIAESANNDTWRTVDVALRSGLRELPGGSSLPQLLTSERGVRNRQSLPHLSIAGILHWADQHRARTGRWPIKKSGPILDAPGETWMGIEMALENGLRGLSRHRPKMTLAKLLEQQRARRNRARLPKLDAQRVLTWARAHRRRTGRWPDEQSGAIVEAPGETWAGVRTAWIRARRGLAGGMTWITFLSQAE